MKLERTIERNDLLRTRFKGGIVKMSPTVSDLPPWFRGRVLHRLALPQKYMTHDHSEGEFVFAGYVVYWRINDDKDGLSLHVYFAEDLLCTYR